MAVHKVLRLVIAEFSPGISDAGPNRAQERLFRGLLAADLGDEEANDRMRELLAPIDATNIQHRSKGTR